MKYFIIAGEKSGDMHAANLAHSIAELDKNAQMWGWGGENMTQEGVKILKNYQDLAFMGFWEVFKNLFKILSFFKEVKKQILEINPDVVVLVDYAGFNLRVLKWAKIKGFKTVYYIAPKAWAWQENRAYKLAKYVDKLLVIFPFEVAFFEKYGINTVFVGNPLFDEIAKFKANKEFKSENNLDERPIIALLPGSRKQEIKYMQEVMDEIADQNREYQWIVAGISKLSDDIYNFQSKNIKIIYNETYNLLSIANTAVVTSGTATLETGLFKIPQVVVYKTSKISYLIAKNLIRVPYISLINLVAEKEVVKELIQDNFNTKSVFNEIEKLMQDNKIENFQLEEYQKIITKLGTNGASEVAAQQIINI